MQVKTAAELVVDGAAHICGEALEACQSKIEDFLGAQGAVIPLAATIRIF